MNWRVFFGSGIGWLFDAMDVGLLSFVMAALAKDWHLTPAQTGLLGSFNSIGMAIGAVAFGALADRFGRRSIFVWTVLVFGIASGLSALAPSFWILLGLRVIVGLGLGGELPVASSYVSEFAPLKMRGRIVVLLEAFWAVGWILAALISYFLIPQYTWRIGFICASIPALFSIWIRVSLPESPRFKRERTGGFGQLFIKGQRKQTLALSVIWFTVVLSYYGIFLWLPSVMILKGYTLIKGFQYVLWMTLAQLPGYFSAAYWIEKWGRKPVLIIYLLGTALSSIFFGMAQTTVQLMVWGLLLNFFNLGAWGALYAYTPEQFPTAIRTSGAGFSAGIGRIGAVAGPYLVGYLLTIHAALSTIFTIFFVVTLLGVLTVWIFGQETRGTAVE